MSLGAQNQDGEKPTNTEDNSVKPARDFTKLTPELSFPKSGALRSIGEKFTPNPVNGSGNLTIPLAMTASRFSPNLSLSYSSGGGNGPFGLGWSLGLASISRKTEQQLPLYDAGDESDIFILSGSKDLVPIRKDTINGDIVTTYRPRTVSAYSRIQRFERGDKIWWQTLAPDNSRRWFGVYPEADGSINSASFNSDLTIHDPESTNHIFRWLLSEERDDRGNRTRYIYKAEDRSNVPALSEHEANRENSSAQRYIKRILYGLSPDMTSSDPDWIFELVFDYGEHDAVNPEIISSTWPCRKDAFSSYRSGFDIRTYRLCNRILQFNLMPGQAKSGRVLNMATELNYDKSPLGSQVKSIRHLRFQWIENKYETQALPAVEFAYTQARPDDQIHILSDIQTHGTPNGLTNGYRFLDLNGEGLSGILTEQADIWYYRRNLGDGNFTPPTTLSRPSGWTGLNAGAQLSPIESNGTNYLVSYGSPTGYAERLNNEEWGNFVPFLSKPNENFNHPNARWLDLNGDGKPEFCLLHDEVISWYDNEGTTGFGPRRNTSTGDNIEKGPAQVFQNGLESIYTSDMTGDGLTDIIRVRNGEISYWPNLGYGKFGPRVRMDNAPRFASDADFDSSRLRLSDIDGSGTADILYLGNEIGFWLNQSGNSWSEKVLLPAVPHIDQMTDVGLMDLLGNGTSCLVWSSSSPTDSAAPWRYLRLMTDRDLTQVDLSDVPANHPSLIDIPKSSDGLGDLSDMDPLIVTQLELAGAKITQPSKPYLLRCVDNNMGMQTRLSYKPSTYYYLKDQENGLPWLRHLHFPVHVIDRQEVIDFVSDNRYVSRFWYRHGFYNKAERQFEGFGYFEQTDMEGRNLKGERIFDRSPKLTKQWHHLGAYIDEPTISRQFETEYYQSTHVYDLPDSIIEDRENLTVAEIQQAKAALAGQPLRSEIYACQPLQSGQERPTPKGHPYSITSTRSRVQKVLPEKISGPYSIFQSLPEESLTQVFEADERDPRIAHEMTLETNIFGQVLKSASIAYGRKNPDGVHADEQTKTHIIVSENEVINRPDEMDWLRLGVPATSKTWELGNDENLTTGDISRPHEIANLFQNATVIKDMRTVIQPNKKRLLSVSAQLYRPDSGHDFGYQPLDLYELESMALPGRSYALVYAPTDVDAAEGKFTKQDFVDSQYVDPLDLIEFPEHGPLGALQNFIKDLPDIRTVNGQLHSGWWARDNEAELSPVHFYAPIAVKDAWENVSHIEMDALALTPIKVTNALNHTVTAEIDYRVMAPKKITDANGNIQVARYDILGRPIQTAIMGENGEGDQLDSLTEFDETSSATTWMEYSLYKNPSEPAYVHSYSRETHHSDLAVSETSRWVEARVYSDGFGREALSKAMAAQDPKTGEDLWLTSAKTIFDNKGNPVMQYEPYFTDTVEYSEGPQAHGVTPIIYYDAMDRAIATELPDGTKSKTVFTPWEQESWDALDCIGLSFERFDIDGTPAWSGSVELGHQATPAIQYLDSLGRPFKTQVKNYNPITETTETYISSVEMDIVGNVLRTYDAKGHTDSIKGQLAQEDWFDRAGRPIKSTSNDAGTSFGLPAIDGQPRIGHLANGHRIEQDYDALRRPTNLWVTEPDGTHYLREAIVYADDPAFPGDNGIGKPWRIFDPCGMVDTPGYDFKGLPLSTTRHVLGSLMNANSPPPDKTDWQVHNLSSSLSLFSESYTTFASLDALGRPVSSTAPDGSVQSFTYDIGGGLQTVRLKDLPGQTATQNIVNSVTYDSKGRRERIDYGNHTRTEYFYNANNFRLTRIITKRDTLRNLSYSDILQDLRYTYDPLGNILKISDEAQDPIFTNNQAILPEKSYAYDSLSRLVEAKGREHLAQSAPDQTLRPDGLTGAGAKDAAGLSRYREEWVFDAIGNIETWKHFNADPLVPNWKRDYTYGEAGNNRLTETKVGTQATTYEYDVAGNITVFGHMSGSRWNVDDQPEHMTLHGNQFAHYRYDASGERFYKRTEINTGSGTKVSSIRLYLGGYEIYREYDNSGAVSLRRDSLHAMDGQSRILLIETEKQNDDITQGQAPVRRWQYSDHLGSSAMEMDSDGSIISYEECHAYGSTSWHWSNAGLSQKRYRYTGMERDKESGLQYHSARYYMPWLGRWLSADPLGIVDGPGLWSYVRGNPVKLSDASGTQGILSPEEIYDDDGNKITPSINPYVVTATYDADGNGSILTDEELIQEIFEFQDALNKEIFDNAWAPYSYRPGLEVMDYTSNYPNVPNIKIETNSYKSMYGFHVEGNLDVDVGLTAGLDFKFAGIGEARVDVDVVKVEVFSLGGEFNTAAIDLDYQHTGKFNWMSGFDGYATAGSVQSGLGGGIGALGTDVFGWEGVMDWTGQGYSEDYGVKFDKNLGFENETDESAKNNRKNWKTHFEHFKHIEGINVSNPTDQSMWQKIRKANGDFRKQSAVILPGQFYGIGIGVGARFLVGIQAGVQVGVKEKILVRPLSRQELIYIHGHTVKAGRQ